MAEHDIPGCPDFETFDDPEAACDFIDEYDGDLVIKPAGLTGGKGVKVIGDQVTAEEGKEYIRDSDYDRIVLEERLIGEEFTVQAFVANGSFETAPAVQDHKRAYEGDEGPNTGGMGSYSDAATALPFMTDADYDEAVSIIEATVDELEDYRGILYGQYMLTSEGPKVIEFNARFGDPEAMNTLPVLETDFLDVLVAARDGESVPDLEFADQATVCKYAVPEGYPTNPDAGAQVKVDEESAGDALLYYASVDERDDGIYTTTSRSFALVGLADSITEAEAIAEDASQSLVRRDCTCATTSANPTSSSNGSTTWTRFAASNAAHIALQRFTAYLTGSRARSRLRGRPRDCLIDRLRERFDVDVGVCVVRCRPERASDADIRCQRDCTGGDCAGNAVSFVAVRCCLFRDRQSNHRTVCRSVNGKNWWLSYDDTVWISNHSDR